MRYYSFKRIAKECERITAKMGREFDEHILFRELYRGRRTRRLVSGWLLSMDTCIEPLLRLHIDRGLMDMRKFAPTPSERLLLRIRLGCACEYLPALCGAQIDNNLVPQETLGLKCSSVEQGVLWSLTTLWSLFRREFCDTMALALVDLYESYPYD